MKSIRGQLIVGLIAAVTALEFLVGAGLYQSMRSALLSGLDAEIAAKAQGIAAGVTIDEGKVHFHPPDADAKRSVGGVYYEIWRVHGAILAKSPALGNADLPRKAEDEVFDLASPNGAPGRAVSLRFAPAAEDAQSLPVVEPFVIVVTQDATSVRQSLRILLSSLIMAAIYTAAGIAVVVTLVVRRSLKPLGDVARSAAAIDPQARAFRFPIDAMPSELTPICLKLNDLLGRLDMAFRRERRFTSDVAHELRTPIAELRSMTEVSMRWPDEIATRSALADALQIARQMETIISTLLALARGTDASDIIDPEPVGLTGIIERAWQSWQEKSDAKQIRFTPRYAEGAAILTDAALLNSILQNLFSNAVYYTPRDGEIRITSRLAGDKAIVTIENTNPGIDAHDLSHLFEPFWRKDMARSDSAHSGLGLALVAEYARILDIQVRAGLNDESLFEVTLSLPLAGDFAARQSGFRSVFHKARTPAGGTPRHCEADAGAIAGSRILKASA